MKRGLGEIFLLDFDDDTDEEEEFVDDGESHLLKVGVGESG